MTTIARVYKANIDIDVTNDADQDIFCLINTAAKKAILHGFSLTSNCTTDERVELTLLRRSTDGSGGTGVTGRATDEDNTIAATLVPTVLRTTPGTAGNLLGSWRWSQQNELLYLPTPEIRETITAATSGRLCLHLGTAVASTRAWNGWVAWEEL